MDMLSAPNTNDSDMRVLENYGGYDRNNLKNILQVTNADEETELSAFIQSSYVDTDRLGELMKNHKDKFTVLSLNVQSLRAKYDSIILLLQELLNNGFEYSVLCFQETWLGENVDTSHLQLPNYNLVLYPSTTSSHGGLACYIHKRFKYTIRFNAEPSQIWEGQFIDISGGGLHKTITVGNIYKPPRNYSVDNIKTFLDDITPYLTKLENEKSDSIIVGDFNLNLLQLNEKELISDYLTTFVSHSFYPKVTLPTRFSKRNCTLIDQIFCKISENTTSVKCQAGILMSQISDHLPCFISIECHRSSTTTPKYVSVPTTDETSIQNFCDDLSQTNFTDLINNDISADPNANYDIFEKIILNSKEKFLPTKSMRFNKYKHKKSNWITIGVLKSIKYRDKLYRKLKSCKPDSLSYQALEINLKSYTRILKKTIREAKKQYYNSRFDLFKSDARKTWGIIREILNKTKQSTEFPNSFLVNDKLITDKRSIADQFNKYFTDIGPKLASEISVGKKDKFKDFLKNKVPTSFEFSLINANDVSKIISKMKKKSSSGHDGISSKLLHQICPAIVSPLTTIINQSLYNGIFPDSLKLAKVLPLFKKGNEKLFNNYRPISLLPTISKVFEKVVFKQLYNYCESNGLIYKSQYGFREKHSTELACAEYVDKMLNELDKKKIPISVFIDLSKAFDTLDHNIMLYKLEHYGVSGTTLNWFNSYLCNRYQYVDFDSCLSEKLQIHTGVPQGSILGPLLFIIYMNDLHVASDKFDPVLYADDTTLSAHLALFNPNIKQCNQLSNSINHELEKIYIWLCANKLSLNIDKTKYMIIHYKQRNIGDINLDIKIQGIDIERVQDFCFLGLTINENMTWHSHINRINSKISRTLGALNRLKNFLPTDVLRTIYNSLILPHITYCIIIWGFECQRLTKIQKRCIRTVCCAKYNAHTEPLFKTLNLLKIEDIFKYHVLKFYFKLTNRTLPVYFNSMAITNADYHNYGTRQRDNLHVPVSRTTQACKRIRHYLPSLIHVTPNNVLHKVTSHSYAGFSSYVKRAYLNAYKLDCQIPDCYICNSV